ncbi:hypothetical protein EZS27_038292, partial [termite gut metagenome]
MKYSNYQFKIERLSRLLEEAKWIFAKTMPDNPHFERIK